MASNAAGTAVIAADPFFHHENGLDSEEYVSNSEAESEEYSETSSVEEQTVPSHKNGASARKNRRRAGDRSGRQMAIRQLQKEGNVEPKKLPTFLVAVKESRRILQTFMEEEEDAASSDHASAMRVYMCKKYGISSKVSLTILFSFVISLYKFDAKRNLINFIH